MLSNDLVCTDTTTLLEKNAVYYLDQSRHLQLDLELYRQYQKTYAMEPLTVKINLRRGLQSRD